jgi:hypothetical protein
MLNAHVGFSQIALFPTRHYLQTKQANKHGTVKDNKGHLNKPTTTQQQWLQVAEATTTTAKTTATN